MAKDRSFSMRAMLAVGICKTSRELLHLLGKGGTSLPGILAAAADPKILEEASAGMQVFIVTGTNGKTTTARMLAAACTLAGKNCLQNRSGANLLAGITAEFACSATWRGRAKRDCAVIECDEAALKQVVPHIHPDVIIVTNLFRDQLDRYGEVMGTRAEILKGIAAAPDSILCLNADCSLTASLADDPPAVPADDPPAGPAAARPGRTMYYGLNVPAGEKNETGLSDAKYCIRCGTAYRYNYHTYAHLGGFWCPNCGYRRPEPDAAVTGIAGAKAEPPRIRLRIRLPAGEKEYDVQAGLPAVYNIYNAAAAVCGGLAAGLPVEALLRAIGQSGAAFGRMETFYAGSVRMQMILVKNPAGCNQAIGYVTGTEEDYDVVFGLNDRTADGHDISWIWDVDYETMARDPHLKKVYVCGVQAEDMQLRLKYAGFCTGGITLEKDLKQLAARLKHSSRPVFILPNYTAMLEMRQQFQTWTDKDAFWKG